ncbi:UNKNOWN [Stylonychia lemnae]|uniref:Uncharacterized protein n=1 Tax=Stylonychia lemnae TaxID=5949 RepID=A0A078A1W9_STYLE|nr:UNKNOWN [Stylonychia lemnae]|eukprot:CDW76236.1 UNKNOWN [Stylonychia lemnae]
MNQRIQRGQKEPLLRVKDEKAQKYIDQLSCQPFVKQLGMIINECKSLDNLFKKLVPRIKDFITETEEAALHAIKGLEAKLDNKTPNQFESQKIVEEYQANQKHNMENMVQNVHLLRSNLTQLDQIKLQKSQLNIDMQFNVESVPFINNQFQTCQTLIAQLDNNMLLYKTNLNHSEVVQFQADEVNNSIVKKSIIEIERIVKFAAVHQDRLICDLEVYCLKSLKKLQNINSEDAIFSVVGVNESMIVAGHDMSARLSMWLWIGTEYEMISKFAFYPGNKLYKVLKLEKDPYSIQDSVIALFGETSVQQVQLGQQNIKYSQRRKLCKTTFGIQNFKLLSPSRIILIQVGKNIIVTKNFDLDEFPILFSVQHERLKMVDMKQVGYNCKFQEEIMGEVVSQVSIHKAQYSLSQQNQCEFLILTKYVNPEDGIPENLIYRMELKSEFEETMNMWLKMTQSLNIDEFQPPEEHQREQTKPPTIQVKKEQTLINNPEQKQSDPNKPSQNKQRGRPREKSIKPKKKDDIKNEGEGLISKSPNPNLHQNYNSSDLIQYSIHLIKDIQQLNNQIDKIVPKIKEFTKNSENIVLNIIKGLENKINNRMNKSQSAEAQNITQDIRRYEEQNMPKAQELKNQVIGLKNFMDGIDTFKAQKINICIDVQIQMQVDPVQLPFSIWDSTYIHELSNKIYAIKDVDNTRTSLIQFYEGKQTHIPICGFCSLKNDMIAVALTEYGKINIYKWDGKQYNCVQKYRNNRGSSEYMAQSMILNEFEFENQLIYRVGETIYQFPIVLNVKAEQKPKVIGRCRELLHLRQLDPNTILAQSPNQILMFDLNQSAIISTVNYAYESPCIVPVSFSIDNFPIVLSQIQNQIKINDALKVGYQGSISLDKGLISICQIKLSDSIDKQNSYVLAKDHKNEFKILKISIN